MCRMLPTQFRRTWLILIGLGLIVLGILAYKIPAINERFAWRMDFALTYLRNFVVSGRADPHEAAQAPLARGSPGNGQPNPDAGLAA